MIRLAQKPFLSVQGEGPRTGKLTIFVRFFGCNLRCPGFFQSDPTNPESYIIPIKADPKSFNTLNDFHTVEYGCDTLYAIDPNYKHLAITYETTRALVEEIESLLPKNSSGYPTWTHPVTYNEYDICFTGGEPLLHQQVIEDILSVLHEDTRFTYPDYVQFETNGTKELTAELAKELRSWFVLFNVSPKLFSVSGEPSDKAWFPDIIKRYHQYGKVSLKFVVNNTDIAFIELYEKTKSMGGIPIYIMPVGSSFTQQTDYATISAIATKAIERGYHVSGRLHCILFGNDIER